MSRLRQYITAWVDHPTVDYPIAALLTGAIVGLGTPSVDYNVKGAFYQTVVAADGVLLALGAVSITIVLTVTPNDRFDRVLSTVGPRLKTLIMSSLAGIGIAMVGFLALFLDLSWSPEVRRLVFVGLGMVSMLRFGRLWWLFDRIAGVLTSPSASAPTWVVPEVGEGDYVVPARELRR